MFFFGSGKSTIFNKLSKATIKREEWEEQLEKEKLCEHAHHRLADAKKTNKNLVKARNDQWSRHIITNDVSYCLL